MQLNKNNFLRWEGSFNEASFTAEAVNDDLQTDTKVKEVTLQPLANDISTYGIDYSTFEITQQVNTDKPASWNPINGNLTIFLPEGVQPGVLNLRYRWEDLNQNLSNEATIAVTVIARATGWRVHPPSFVCVMEGGVRTGYSRYNSLQRYYLDDSTTVSPLETKGNDAGDPDYVAPVLDHANCPVTEYVSHNLSFSPDGYESACQMLFPASSYYTSKDQPYLTYGVTLASNQALTLPAADGWYGNLAQAFRVASGTIIEVRQCNFIP